MPFSLSSFPWSSWQALLPLDLTTILTHPGASWSFCSFISALAIFSFSLCVTFVCLISHTKVSLSLSLLLALTPQQHRSLLIITPHVHIWCTFLGFSLCTDWRDRQVLPVLPLSLCLQIYRWHHHGHLGCWCICNFYSSCCSLSLSLFLLSVSPFLLCSLAANGSNEKEERKEKMHQLTASAHAAGPVFLAFF